MENFIQINGRRIVLTEGQTEAIRKAFSGEESAPAYTVGDIPAGEACTIGGFEFIVLEHIADKAAVLMKDLLHENEVFGENNDYRGSNVDELCETFAEALEEEIGKGAIVHHTVDLTSDDGLKDYGTVERKASLLTTEQYRRYVEILDKHKLDEWWWLSTPYSTPAHEDDEWIKCVSPSGGLNCRHCNRVLGVRPFCILKSDILVSK